MSDVQLSIPSKDVPKLTQSILSLCHAATYSPNFGAYQDDIECTLSLLLKLIAQDKINEVQQ